MTVTRPASPPTGRWWWEDHPAWFRDEMRFDHVDQREFCHCGREMVLTVEKSGLHARDDGAVLWERWHSCPRYLVSSWKVFFGLGGYGHESHDADEPIKGREWR